MLTSPLIFFFFKLDFERNSGHHPGWRRLLRRALLLFPEGTCSNGRDVWEFRQAPSRASRSHDTQAFWVLILFSPNRQRQPADHMPSTFIVFRLCLCLCYSYSPPIWVCFSPYGSDRIPSSVCSTDPPE